MTERALSGGRIIVLGGTGSLGQSVTERFLADGASVLVADARPPTGASRQEDADYVIADALDEASVSAALAKSPPASAVVNLIGGYTPPQALSGLAVSVLRQQLDVNLVTAAIITKYAMAVLAARGGGPLVHVSSRVAAEKGENGFAYSVSKLGVVRLVQAAAAEGRASCAAVAAGTPGGTGTWSRALAKSARVAVTICSGSPVPSAFQCSASRMRCAALIRRWSKLPSMPSARL